MSPWRKWYRLALVISLLAPAAWLAFEWRAMPQLGFYHDDSLYWVAAKSLAAGNGYRIESLPGQPFQTKYPPLFPALLALVWRVDSSFPGNLPWATLLVWLFYPLYLGLVWRSFKQFAFTDSERPFLLTLAAMNPLAVLFSFSLMAELLFTSLLLASLLVAERREHSAWIAGALAGVAYLAKSTALPLLLTVPLAYALRKRYRPAILFLLAMLPAVAGWHVWVLGHMSKSQDWMSLYYTNYAGQYSYNVGFKDIPLVIWYNLDAYLMAAGKLLTFDTALLDSKHLERLVAIAAITGSVRLARKTRVLQYPLTALGLSLVFLLWNWQPDQRVVFPLYPLLLAGLWTELKNVCETLKMSWAKPALAARVAAGAGAALLAGFAIFVITTTLFGLFGFLPRLLHAYQKDLQARVPAYAWIANITPGTATLYAYDDPVAYLYTGRKSCSLPVPTKYFYHDDAASIDRMVDGMPQFARSHRLDYMFVTRGDYYRDLHEERAQRLLRVLRSDPGLTLSFQSPNVWVYAVKTVPSQSWTYAGAQ